MAQHILVVDDETSIIMVLKSMLVQLGYNVLTASDGAQAFEMVSLGGVDLVITDMVMPNVNGIDLIVNLQEKFPRLKIIAMSGGGLQEGPEGYLKEAQKLGVTRCLTKPFMLKDLSAMVKELMDDNSPSGTPARPPSSFE